MLIKVHCPFFKNTELNNNSVLQSMYKMFTYSLWISSLYVNIYNSSSGWSWVEAGAWADNWFMKDAIMQKYWFTVGAPNCWKMLYINKRFKKWPICAYNNIEVCYKPFIKWLYTVLKHGGVKVKLYQNNWCFVCYLFIPLCIQYMF